MNKKRLLKLADLLEANAKNKKGVKFDMWCWGRVTDKKNPLSCGTTACAMGLAAISGAFKKDGLSLTRIGSDGGFGFKWKGRHLSGITVGSRLFEIPHGDSYGFFMPMSGQPIEGAKAERALAKRIRKYVAEKSAA